MYKVRSIQRPYGLTAQEFRLIQALVDFGGHLKSIQDDWVVTRRTVETHLKNTYWKMNVHSKTELVVKALREGIAKL